MLVVDKIIKSFEERRHRALLRPGDTEEIKTAINGLLEYKRTGNVSTDVRSAVLNLHCQTNGQFTDRLAAIVRNQRRPRAPKPVQGFLGSLTAEKQRTITASLKRDGFHIFDQRLPNDVCDEIFAFAKQQPSIVEGRGREPKDRVVFDPDAPISKTYRIIESDITSNPTMQRLMADPSFVAIAEMYLDALPILSMMNLWWSPTFGDMPGDAAAQEFHFDFDPPPIWLLFFVYLTDVGPENGPHVFVRGSHVADHPASADLLKRGYARIPDRDIEAAFGRENVVELCGKRGTILAVDTRGFHKGKMPTAGHRLITQLTFSCPPYSGAHGHGKTLPVDKHPSLSAAIAKTPKVYERYK